MEFGSDCYFVVVSYIGLVRNRMQTKEAEPDRCSVEASWRPPPKQLKQSKAMRNIEFYFGKSNRTSWTSSRQPHRQTMKASDALTHRFHQYLCSSRKYPDLKASANFIKLEKLTNTENKISYSHNSTTCCP